MAGPWTISRDRRDGEDGGDLRSVLGPLGTRSVAKPLRRLMGLRSALATTVRLPVIARPKIRWPAVRLHPVKRPPGVAVRRLGQRDPAAHGRLVAWWAVPLLAVLTVVAVLLGLATYHIAERAVTISRLAAKRVGGPLVIPPPRIAGGYPKRLGVINDPTLLAIDAPFRQRFGAIGGKLVYEARRAASASAQASSGPDGSVTTSWTSGLYGQPGRLDPTTFRPAWILYRGLDTTGLLGRPSVTIVRVMRGLLGQNAVLSPWRVAVGHRGGSASCAAGWLGQKWVSVCGWATEHTIGAIVSPARDTSVRALAVAMVKMRYDLQRG